MNRRLFSLLLLVCLLVFAGAGIGCGPIEYLTSTTSRASKAVAAAKAVEADRLAPYEYYGAVEYLHKAREEAGYANFQVAVEFGRQAATLAQKARELAARKRGDEPPLASERRQEVER